MPLDKDLREGPISPLVREEGNVVGQPGGGPLASGIQPSTERRFRAFASELAVAGTATIEFAGPTVGFAWLVERIAVQGAGAAAVYVGAVDDAGFVDFTPTATQDIADNNSPIYVPGGTPLIVQFTGAGVANCRVGLQIELRRES